MPEALTRSYVCPSLTVQGRTFVWGERTYVMAILNVSPDSFSGDGTGADTNAAVATAERAQAAGADILDVGAESTRPGAASVAAGEELARLLPVLRAVRAATALPISVDTYHAETAAAALDCGADMVNDVHGLADPSLAGLLARRGAAAVAMHNQRGREGADVIEAVAAGFERSLAMAAETGIAPGSLVLDPGFGFGWRPEQNLEMVRRLPELWRFGLPLLVGPSRKSTLGMVLDRPVEERTFGTAALVALAVAGGADIVRVHDVAEMADVVRTADATVRGTWRPAGDRA